MHIGFWDVALVVVVSVQATSLAYLHHPRWKALVLLLPIPFTLATLAVGKPVDVTNVLGLMALVVYLFAVRWLHDGLRIPIVAAIACSALGYCALGATLARFVPGGGASFWASAGAAFVLGLALRLLLRPSDEPGHRSPMKPWKKLVVVAGVIVCIVAVKQHLRGFTTFFPMVSTVGAYEARHSLRTLGLYVPVVVLSMLPMLCTMRLVQGPLGLAGALAAGWIVFLSVLVPQVAIMWRRHRPVPTG